MKHGKHYIDAAKQVDSTKLYDVNEALELACKLATAKFDETVELHVRLGVDSRHADQQVRGAVVLPNGTGKPQRVLDFAGTVTDAKFALCRDPLEAAANADVVITDVWASMGQEEEKERRQRAFGGLYQVNEAVMAAARPGAMVLHCLPAHRGEEITAEVFEAHAGEIFDEAENRLHAQKAVLYLLMGEQV